MGKISVHHRAQKRDSKESSRWLERVRVIDFVEFATLADDSYPLAGPRGEPELPFPTADPSSSPHRLTPPLSLPLFPRLARTSPSSLKQQCDLPLRHPREPAEINRFSLRRLVQGLCRYHRTTCSRDSRHQLCHHIRLCRTNQQPPTRQLIRRRRRQRQRRRRQQRRQRQQQQLWPRTRTVRPEARRPWALAVGQATALAALREEEERVARRREVPSCASSSATACRRNHPRRPSGIRLPRKKIVLNKRRCRNQCGGRISSSRRARWQGYSIRNAKKQNDE